MMLMMSIVAGAGLMSLRKLELPGTADIRLKRPLMTQAIGMFLGLILVGVTLAIAIPDHQNTPYYHMIDKQDYDAFVWIRDNVHGSYQKAILDPWKATAFTAITGKKVFTRIHAFPVSRDNEAYKFLENGSRDSAFLKENDISIVYSRLPCYNPDLIELRENVYLLAPAK